MRTNEDQGLDRTSGSSSQQPAEAESQPSPADVLPGPVEQRSALVKQLRLTSEGLRDLKATIVITEKKLAALPLGSPSRLDLRERLREYKAKIPDYEEELEEGHKRLAYLDSLKGASEGIKAERKAVQLEATSLAAEIRTRLIDLGVPFRKWRELRDRDRQIRSQLPPEDRDLLPFLAWVSCISDKFEDAISSAIVSAHESQKELAIRQTGKHPSEVASPPPSPRPTVAEEPPVKQVPILHG